MCYVDYQTHSVVLLGWQLESRKWEKFKFVINWENRVAWEYKEMVKKKQHPNNWIADLSCIIDDQCITNLSCYQ